MNDMNSRVMVRVEYDRNGITRVWCGEIDELKLEEFSSKTENFIRMENDGKSTWKDKDSILSIGVLGIITRLYEKTLIGSNSLKQDAKT